MELNTVLEVLSVVFGLLFLLLLMRESVWCWIFGISGSALSVALFLTDEVKLYSEAILYSYYVFIGIYGWMRWTNRKTGQPLSVRKWSLSYNLLALTVGLTATPVLGWIMDRYFQSNNPYIDAATTVFSFIASYMQAEKVVSSWHIWIAVNAVSITLYYIRGLELYTALMVVYFAMSVYGLISWERRYRTQLNGEAL